MLRGLLAGGTASLRGGFSFMADSQVVKLMGLECRSFLKLMSARIVRIVVACGVVGLCGVVGQCGQNNAYGDQSILVQAPRRIAAADRGRVDAATVQQAIDRGINYLRSSQNARGGWKEHIGQTGGLSALCTLALLTAGVPADDPAIVKALSYLRELQPGETYSVALQTLVFCQVGSPGDLVRIQRNVRLLESEQIRGVGVSDDRLGGWGYGGGRGGGDPSNAQFALLALQAAEERDVPINPEVYEAAAKYWQVRQRDSGAWAYSGGSTPTGSMTCAGIASTIICRGRLSGASSRVQNGVIQCCGGEPAATDPVQAGIDWLAQRFSVRVNPGNAGSSSLYYYLYALERVGRMTGRRFIGGHDWYREGAERLLELQDNFQGFWAGSGFGEDDRNVTTSFALLFLAKGKRQVALGRLRFGGEADRDDGQWHQHPDASRQMVRRLERFWGRDLTWQTVSIQGATVQDLLQTPVLMITGREALQLDDAEQNLLKDYIDQGGTILFEASSGDGCGDSDGVRRAVTQMCNAWYPTAPLEPLPPTHPAYFAEADVKPNMIAPNYQLYGVQACCRTAIFFSPRSLSCRWELSDPTGRGRVGGLSRGVISGPAADSIEMAARLGQNVIAYATGRELKDKLDGRDVVRAGGKLPDDQRGVIAMARLAMDAGAEEARRALPNLVAIAGERVSASFLAADDDVPAESDQLADVQILWIHGRTEFTWSASQRTQLREFIDRGGIILADAICGSPEFAAAFRREIGTILPDSPLRGIPADHPAMTTSFGGFDLRGVTIRTPARVGGAMEVSRRRGTPLVEVAMVDSVASVFFSPLDLSCALESQNSIQCPGYDTTDAAKVAINLMLYALQQ